MIAAAKVLLVAAGAIYLGLGGLHLAYTFFSRKFEPYDESLKDRMNQATLRLTRQTTLWKAWIGFNASHSTGAMFFGFMLTYSALTLESVTLSTGVLWLICTINSAYYVWLAKNFWFRPPWLGTTLATLFLVIAGIIILLI